MVSMSSPRDSRQPRPSRRLSDKIFHAFHQACDQGDVEVAKLLLYILELTASKPAAAWDRRKMKQDLIEAHKKVFAMTQEDLLLQALAGSSFYNNGGFRIS